MVFTFIMLLFKNMNKFANRWLTLFALLSYPIYLLHQEMGYIYIELLRYDLDSFGSGLVAALAAVVLAYLLDRAVNYLVLPRSANNRV